jgi:hypothetical protein
MYYYCEKCDSFSNNNFRCPQCHGPVSEKIAPYRNVIKQIKEMPLVFPIGQSAKDNLNMLLSNFPELAQEDKVNEMIIAYLTAMGGDVEIKIIVGETIPSFVTLDRERRAFNEEGVYTSKEQEMRRHAKAGEFARNIKRKDVD